MALFELNQDYGPKPGEEWSAPTFKDCAAADLELTFFEENEHAEWHTVDEKKVLSFLKNQGWKERAGHGEGGERQN